MVETNVEIDTLPGYGHFGYSVKYNPGVQGSREYSAKAEFVDDGFMLCDNTLGLCTVNNRTAAENALYQMATDKAIELQKAMTPEIKDLTQSN